MRYNATEEVNIELKGKPGRVLITSTPLKAKVSINGREQGETPYSTTLSPGKYTIRVALKGYKSNEREIEVKPNKSQALNYDLEALPKGQELYEEGGMVLIPAGEFMMGCAPGDGDCANDEKPYHRVYLDAYYIDKHEVTVVEYKKCVDAGACKRPGTGKYCNWDVSGRENHPVNCVDWNQADAYCSWAGKRLPTEAEWEKAARGTDGRIYPWGNERASCKYAVMDERGYGCGRGSTWPVCSKPEGNSPYGLCDMAGNVLEWVNDLFDENYYSSSTSRNPSGPSSGYRLLRGGSWRGNNPKYFRASNRYWDFPVSRLAVNGFRCVRQVSE